MSLCSVHKLDPELFVICGRLGAVSTPHWIVQSACSCPLITLLTSFWTTGWTLLVLNTVVLIAMSHKILSAEPSEASNACSLSIFDTLMLVWMLFPEGLASKFKYSGSRKTNEGALGTLSCPASLYWKKIFPPPFIIDNDKAHYSNIQDLLFEVSKAFVPQAWHWRVIAPWGLNSQLWDESWRMAYFYFLFYFNCISNWKDA